MAVDVHSVSCYAEADIAEHAKRVSGALLHHEGANIVLVVHPAATSRQKGGETMGEHQQADELAAIRATLFAAPPKFERGSKRRRDMGPLALWYLRVPKVHKQAISSSLRSAGLNDDEATIRCVLYRALGLGDALAEAAHRIVREAEQAARKGE